MGRTPAKIEHGVRCCASANIDKCTGCPYAGLHVGIGCKTILFRDVQDYLKEIKISAARIEDMTKQLESAQPKWISVEERLPDDLEEVLILVKETEFYGQYKELSKSYFCQYIGCVDDGEWFTVWCHGHRYIKDTAKEPYADKLEVTHWMPLPEPPKEE